MKKTPFIARVRGWVSRHRIASAIIGLIIIVVAIYWYRSASTANASPQYILSPARIGTITQVVTGSGQVTAENQIDVTSEVSAKVQSINVKVGQHVNKGDVLARLDSTDALVSLQNARIAYAKLVQPAKSGDLANAKNSLTKAYNDEFNAVATMHLDLPAIMAGMKDMFYDSSGFLSDQKATNLISSARVYRETAGKSYDRAAAQYVIALNKYKSMSRSSATSSINSLADDSLELAKSIATALQNLQSAITYITTNQPDYESSLSSSAASNAVSWSNQVNSDLTAIISAQNSVVSAENSLQTLIDGAEPLDIQSQKLSLQQAEDNYAKYTIRSPFAGIVGRVPISVYDQASASTIIATIIGDRKVANISLNEVDAAKVKSGQRVNITFDAIDGLNATGTVDRVDLVGTVSQGVVSYTVRIVVDTADERIKPGMSMNVSIVTYEKPGVIIVPSSAIKTSNGMKYVEVLPTDTLPASTTAQMNQLVPTATTERPQNGFGSTTPWSNATTTSQRNSNRNGNFIGGSFRNTNAQTRTLTVTTTVTPTQIPVTTGDSDDTNVEITEGLTRGQWIITRTISGGGTATAAPSILSSIGGNRSTGGNTRALVRPGN